MPLFGLRPKVAWRFLRMGSGMGSDRVIPFDVVLGTFICIPQLLGLRLAFKGKGSLRSSVKY